MIKIFNKRLLSLICLLMSIAIITSCEKENSGTSAVELLSFGPTGAKHGDTLRFFGNNLNKVTSVDFTGTVLRLTKPLLSNRHQNSFL